MPNLPNTLATHNSGGVAHPYGRPLRMLALFMLSATLVRLALYLAYPADFQGLSTAQVANAFLVGLRFDVSMAVVMIGLPLILVLLPFGWSHHRYWQRAWQWLIYLALLLFIFMMVGDAIYFGNVHRHVGSEINILANDMDSMVGVVLRQYATALVLFGMGAVALAWLWHKALVALPVKPRSPWLRLLALPFLFIGALVVARGGIDGKPLSVGEAFFSNTPAQGYLALNGAFAVSRALLEDPPALREFMPAEQARALVQGVLAGDGAVFPNPDYPLYRSAAPGAPGKKPNVVVLMLESWGAQHIDALRMARNEAPLGVTPNFDALARTGRLFNRFYANGQRSIQGAAAILSSQPTFPGMPFLGEGIEQNRQSFMGELARSQGYETFFLQSSERGSLRFDAIAARAGFGTYRGAEDIANLHETPKPAATWGTWDHNTLQAAHQLFAKARQPFLGFVFTSTTHTPWLIPDARFEKFKGKSDKDLFINTLYYADWALGELIAAAKKAGYYDNTIFVLVADHADEFVSDSSHIPNLYNVPLLIVGPGIQPGMDARIGSQFDILPTLIDVCSWQTPYAGMGRSLLDNSRMEARASLSVRGSELDWITSAGWVSHNLDRPLGQSPGLSAALAEQLNQQLLAAYQTASQAQSHHKILPPLR
jgi:arylsulfatase A-like enzyme